MNFKKNNFDKIETRYKKTSRYLSNKFQSVISKIILILGIYASILIISLGLGVVTGVVDNAPNVKNINITPQDYLTTIYDKNENEIHRLVQSGSNRIFIPIDNIPKHVQDAFVAIEDHRFWKHHGIDQEGIVRAFILGLSKGSFSEGASTLTQQLIKNAVFDGGNEPTFLQKIKRKLQEQFLALEVEKEISKTKVLEGYLNTIYFGYNTLGIQTASRRYFNKDVSDLTISEAAVLAAIPQAPARLAPIDGIDANRKRREKVLSSMLKYNFITQEEYDEALADDVYSRIVKENKDSSFYASSYFTDALIDQLTEDLMSQLGLSKREAINKIYSGGLKIYSTQDSKAQQIANNVANSDIIPIKGYTITYRLSIKDKDGNNVNLSDLNITARLRKEKNNPEYTMFVYNEQEARDIIEEYKSTLGDYKLIDEKLVLIPQPQIAFTLLDSHSGDVRALVGGRGNAIGSGLLNRATQVYRQPGSSIKPLVSYGPALDLGAIHLSDKFTDEPYRFPNGGPSINTPYGNFFGEVDLTTALCVSLNVPAVKVMERVRPERALPYLKKMDFDHVLYQPDDNGNTDVTHSSALGGFTYGISNIQLASGYATLANKGIYTKPRFYTKVLDQNGEVLIDNYPYQKQVYKSSTARDLTNILVNTPSVYIKNIIGIGNFDDYTTQIACKTGTTNKYRDVLLCGYSNYYAASIWVGYDNYEDTVYTGNQIRAWNNIMHEVHKGVEYKKIYE